MISAEDVAERVSNKKLNFRQFLATVAVYTLAAAVPVVYINGLTVNLSSVQCHRLQPRLLKLTGWESYLSELWCQKVVG